MGIVIKMYFAVKAVITFAFRRPKDITIIILALLLAIMFWRLNQERTQIQKLSAKTEELPPDTKQVVTIYRDRIITKWRDGPTKIVYQDRYLPPEGHVEIITKENEPEKTPEIKVKDWGFTSRLGGGIVYSENILPLVDFKWFYWKRYSLNVGITPEFAGLGISRHIDDFTPFKNLEICTLAGLDWHGSWNIGVGLRINF